MTGVLVILLAILWAAVLVPPLLRSREDASLGSVGSFSRSMHALGSSHSPPLTGGRYVLAPRTPLDRPDPRLLIYRRRRIFCGLVAGLLVSLGLGAIPGMHVLLWVSLLMAIAVAGFAAFLVAEKSRNANYLRLSSTHRTPHRRQDLYVPTELRSYEEEQVRVVGRSQPVFRMLDEDEEDDGLSELGWARAGRL